MPHKIFLSHNHNDKPLVEAVALRLANIFGQDQIFYDSWSILPGDGIIDQMNKGLETPEFVFFFVSAQGLKSDMVKLEWQNALYAATKGKTRLIPIRVDGCNMPTLLQQTLYIDMYSIGLEATIAQIVSLTQGNASFIPQFQTFSNLTYSIIKLVDGSYDITINASHMMEPNPNFAFVLLNEENEISYWIKNHPGIMGGFYEEAFQLNDNSMANAVIMKPINSALTPLNPLTFQLKQQGNNVIKLIDVLHQHSQKHWNKVPFAN